MAKLKDRRSPRFMLLSVLGPQGLQRLIDAFGGQLLRVPKHMPVDLGRRDRALMADLGHLSYRRTARKHGVPTSTVQRASERV